MREIASEVDSSEMWEEPKKVTSQPDIITCFIEGLMRLDGSSGGCMRAWYTCNSSSTEDPRTGTENLVEDPAVEKGCVAKAGREAEMRNITKAFVGIPFPHRRSPRAVI